MKEHEAATLKINEDKDTTLKTINKELDSATGKSLGENIIKQSFERIGVSTELNRDAILEFANISKDQKFINELPKDDLFVNK